MNEDRFWSMIEEAWRSVGGKVKPRQKLAEGTLSKSSGGGMAPSTICRETGSNLAGWPDLV
jgi:hypothetical protein